MHGHLNVKLILFILCYFPELFLFPLEYRKYIIYGGEKQVW